jgi:GntR family transcriptional regulator
LTFAGLSRADLESVLGAMRPLLHDHLAGERPPAQVIPVQQALRARIDSGEIPAGGMLPSVSQIQGECGVAKITAQKALHVLVDEGLARVVKGWGTFRAD